MASGPRPPPAPPLALTMGEPGGIGGEITAAAWRILHRDGPVFFAIDDPQRLRRFDVPVVEIAAPERAAAAFSAGLPVLPLAARIDARAGHAHAAFAPQVIASIEAATGFTLAGRASAVVTNPIQKATLIAAGFAFPGHTEFLENLCANAAMPQGRRRGAVMLLAGPDLRTAPMTLHQSVVNAAQSLTTTLIVNKAAIIIEALQMDFGVTHPRLAVSGLNPHAGEDGAMGHEDRTIIAPAVAQLRALGHAVVGPLPADTMFHERARATYDVALCMLHDQALIPVKTLAFDDAVNVTLGLPIIRTSPDHGTALDIAGTGRARPDSLVAALRLAAHLAATRAAGSAKPSR